jgi:hypothetical protein
VISVGGVFIGNDDSIQASNYASSGTNRFSDRRQCPDLCGLTGMAPQGIYIAMPIQAGSDLDRHFSGYSFPQHDETNNNDGWVVASGTSSATPMVAGVVALLIEHSRDLSPRLTPAEIKRRLLESCIPITRGNSASGQSPPSATGAGLVQAYRALFPIDVWIKDNNISDIGLIPTHGRRPSWPPYSHWTSPDIKLFSSPLPGMDLANEFDSTPEHSNPIYGQTNYVYVRIRNRGVDTSLTPTGATTTVGLYYANPSTNLIFPADWNDGQSGIPEQGRITVNGIATNLQTNITIPTPAASQPDGHYVLAQPFEWQPPAPTPDTIVQTLPDGIAVGHFCLLVRIETLEDPIISSTISSTSSQSIVIDDNNIGMKNVHVYSASRFTTLSARRFHHMIFHIRGGQIEKHFGNEGQKEDTTTKNDLLFDSSNIPNEADIIIQILANSKDKSRILEKVKLIGAFYKDDDIHLNSGSTITNTKEKITGIYGINLKSDEKIKVKVSVKLTDQNSYGDYILPIMQISNDVVVGGLDFVARLIE